MREVRWERMFPDELEAAFAAHPLVYFAYGLCEPHGPRNTLGLDTLKAPAPPRVPLHARPLPRPAARSPRLRLACELERAGPLIAPRERPAGGQSLIGRMIRG